MSEYLEIYANQFGVQIPRSNKGKIIEVPQGQHRIGNGSNHFVSREIGPCSGYLFMDKSASFYGYYHSYPYPDITDESLDELSDFSGGKFRAINGSESREKTILENHLVQALGIMSLAAINIDTLDKGGRPNDIDTLFMPEQNRLYIARSSHQDILPFKVF